MISMSNTFKIPQLSKISKDISKNIEHLENLEHLKSVVLKFLEAPDWDTQQQMIPVLGTLLRWDPSDFRRVHRAREAWEPADVTIAKHLPELGGYGNSITSSLGLGNIF